MVGRQSNVRRWLVSLMCDSGGSYIGGREWRVQCGQFGVVFCMVCRFFLLVCDGEVGVCRKYLGRFVVVFGRWWGLLSRCGQWMLMDVFGELQVMWVYVCYLWELIVNQEKGNWFVLQMLRNGVGLFCIFFFVVSVVIFYFILYILIFIFWEFYFKMGR